MLGTFHFLYENHSIWFRFRKHNLRVDFILLNFFQTLENRSWFQFFIYIFPPVLFKLSFCKYENHQFVKVIFHSWIFLKIVKKLIFRVELFNKNELDLMGTHWKMQSMNSLKIPMKSYDVREWACFVEMSFSFLTLWKQRLLIFLFLFIFDNF
jgi:hypothetical protein